MKRVMLLLMIFNYMEIFSMEQNTLDIEENKEFANLLINDDIQNFLTISHNLEIKNFEELVFLAVYMNSKNILQHLINIKRDKITQTILDGAILAEIHDLEMMEILITAGANINSNDSFQRTPLMLAFLHNSPKVAEYLISKGADINLKDFQEKTASDYSKELTEKLNHSSTSNFILQFKAELNSNK